jgi:hypothetical protein
LTEAFLGTRAAKSPDLAGREEEDHEEHLEDGGRGLEEVVLVRRDELAELVDEGAETGATDHGCSEPRARREVQKQKKDRDEHSETAPQHLGDVQPTAAKLWIIRCREENADYDDRRNCGDEESVQEICVVRADEVPRPDVRRAIVGQETREAAFRRPLR